MGDLRSMTVLIDFKDKATASIKKVNKETDKAKTEFATFGKKIDDNERKLNAFGKTSSKIGGKISDVWGKTKKVFSGLGDSIDKASAKMGSFAKYAGGTAAAGIGGAVGGFTAAAGKEFIEMDTAFSHLEARTNATGKELEALKNTSKTLYSEGFGENIPQISSDLSILAGQFKNLSEKQLTSMGKGIYTVTELWGQDFNEVSRTVSVLQKNFDGLSETDALDAITYGFQNGMDFSGELLDTLREYAPQFNEMGMSVENMMAVLQAGTDAGAWNLDKVGDAIKESHLRMGALDKATVEAYKSMGFNAEEYVGKISKGGEIGNKAFQEVVSELMKVEDATLRNQLATDLFGTQYEDLQEKVIFAMADATNATIDFGGATEKASKKMQDNFGTKMSNTWKTLKLQMAEAFEDAGGQELLDSIATGAQNLVPKITDMVGKVVEFGTAVRDNWGTIKPILSTLIFAIGGFSAALGALKVVTGVISIFGKLKTIIGGVKIAFGLLSTVMRLSPFGLIITLVTAVITIGVKLWQNWDIVKEKAGALWDKVKEVFGGIFEWGKSKIQPVIDFFGGIVDKFNNLKSALQSFKPPEWVSKIGGFIGGAVKKVTGFLNGSHATGLANVPFDGYRAELHKGESVLTVNQSAALRSAGILKDSGNGTPSISMPPATPLPVPLQAAGGDNVVININIIGDNPSDNARMVRKEIDNYFKRKAIAGY